MSAIVNKITGLTNSAVAKSTQLANCAVYWGKVTAEVGKIVYQKEGLAPPATKDFQTVFNKAVGFLKSSQQQKQFLDKAVAFKPTKADATTAAVYGVQLLAFFSLGEIIGRRKLFGYPAVGGHHH